MTRSSLNILRSSISTFPKATHSKVGLVQKDKYSIPGFNVKICTENSKPLESYHKMMKSNFDISLQADN